MLANAVLAYFLKIKKRSGTSFWCIFSEWFFHKNISYLTLYQWTKFQCHAFFSSQDIKENVLLTLFRMGFSGLLMDGMGEWGQKGPALPKICQRYPTMMRLGTVIPYLNKIHKMYELCDIPLEFCWQHFFNGNQIWLQFWWSQQKWLPQAFVKVLWKKGYDVIISVNDVTNKTL